MKLVERIIRVQSSQHFGRKVPPEPFGQLVNHLGAAFRQSITMATQGRSRVSGRRPKWLDAVTSYRFVGFDGDDDTLLHFEAPQLGEAAPELYAQKELWPDRPSPETTAIELFGQVVRDIQDSNADSPRFDEPLLRTVASFSRADAGNFNSLHVPVGSLTRGHDAILDQRGIGVAKDLYRKTPPPRRVKVLGRLDMVRVSTQTFELELENKEVVRGVLTAGDIGEMKDFLDRQVLIEAQAIYRPSGRVLRLDAERFQNGAGASAAFSRVPQARGSKANLNAVFQRQAGKRGVSAIMGQWPGDESDEQIDVLLRELS